MNDLFLSMDRKETLQRFENWAKKQEISLRDLFPTINKNKVYKIDLSQHNTIVNTESEFNNPDFFGTKLTNIQEKNEDKIIAGGYLEKRNLYTSDLYNVESSSAKRNIHLGVDFWLPENTPVNSLFDGKVVCAIHQKDLKGYGGFVILEHQLDELTFYTLYGHLSKESVDQLSKTTLIEKGQQIGVLGDYEENGEWVPHLHFQVILDLQDYENDFPGVALESEIDFWKTVCPNPNLLFQLEDLG